MIDQKYIDECEAVHDQRIADITAMIAQRKPKLVMIAGPSSSGKTTFSHRLSSMLAEQGFLPHPVSLDDYYQEHSRIPVDEDGKPDYETIYALDVEMIKQHLKALLSGEEVELPRFDFQRVIPIQNTGNMLRMQSNSLLIVEGLHALNPMLIEGIDDVVKLSIYPDDTEMITGENRRLVRRTIRDYKYRNAKADLTFSMWPSVCRGEKTWIRPFLNTVDAHLNSALGYELSAMKQQAVAAYAEVASDSPHYAKAQEMLHALSLVPDIADVHIPENSLLREFLGDKCY